MRYVLKLKQLQCFIAVAEELNFRIAADRLCMTQPPLTRQIKKLEETLGAQLFERDRKGVSITAAGEKFLLDARALMEQAETTVKKYRDADQDEQNEMNIGVTTVVDTHVFQDLMSSFRTKFPAMKTNIRPQISTGLIRNIKRGMLDVALVGLPSQTEDLVIERLFTEPLMAALPSNHRLARKKMVSIADLHEENLFWFNRALNPVYYDLCLRVFKTLDFSPRIIPEPADHHVLLGLIAGGNGIAFIPSSLKTIKRQGVVYKPLVEGKLMSIGVGVAYLPNNASGFVEAFVKLARQCYGS